MTIALLDHSALLRSRRGSDRHHGVFGDQPCAIHPWARDELSWETPRDEICRTTAAPRKEPDRDQTARSAGDR